MSEWIPGPDLPRPIAGGVLIHNDATGCDFKNIFFAISDIFCDFKPQKNLQTLEKQRGSLVSQALQNLRVHGLNLGDSYFC